jgi:hypothetical protein
MKFVTSVYQKRWPLIAGLLGALGLTALYLGIVTLAESSAHALDLFQEDALFVVPIILGFGVQVGLFTHVKLGLHLPEGARGAGALTGATGGASTMAMVACCAHHLTDILPIIGLSAASAFLAEYKFWFMAIGLAMNLIGIAVMLRLLLRERRLALTTLKTQEMCHS